VFKGTVSTVSDINTWGDCRIRLISSVRSGVRALARSQCNNDWRAQVSMRQVTKEVAQK
jgi:hypothetical protein